MRDIRNDLLERIALEEARKEPHARALAAIDANIGTLKQLLMVEESRHRAAIFEHRGGPVNRMEVNLGPTSPPQKPTVTLITYLMEMLTRGPMSLDELRDGAEKAGYFSGVPASSPGRIVHGALLNALRLDEVHRDEHSYSLTNKGRERVSTARQRAMEKITELEV